MGVSLCQVDAGLNCVLLEVLCLVLNLDQLVFILVGLK